MTRRCFICEKRIFTLWQDWDYDRLVYSTKFHIDVTKKRYYHMKCLENSITGPPTNIR